MSYYIFKKKRIVSVDGKIFALANYADSSVRGWDGKRVYDWGVYNIVQPGIFADPMTWEKERTAAIEEEFKKLSECRWITDPITLDSTNYCGNSYPGGSKIRNKKSFLSIRNKISLQDLIYENHGPFSITLNVYSKKSYGTKNSQSFLIKTEQDLILADEKYHEIAKDLSDEFGISLGFSGLCI